MNWMHILKKETKTMRVLNALIAMVVIFVTGIWVQESTSELDPESVMGIWLFEQGKETRLKIPPAMK